MPGRRASFESSDGAVVRGPACCLLVAAAAFFVAGTARATPTKQECIAANTSGQELRRSSRLVAARGQFAACTDPACPALVRDDCTRRLDEIDHVQPTMVFDAKDAAGQDVSAMRVTIDGRPLADRLTGEPLPVDPGEHTFSFEITGQPPVTRVYVIKEGEKDRRERVVVGPAGTPQAPETPPSPAPAGSTPFPGPPQSSTTSVTEGSAPSGTALPKPNGLSPRRTTAVVIAGLGGAGAVVGTIFGLMAVSAGNQQKADCASMMACRSRPDALSDHSSAVTDGTVSTVAFVAGGALLAGGAVLFFTGVEPAEPARAGLRIAPVLTARSGAISLFGEF